MYVYIIYIYIYIHICVHIICMCLPTHQQGHIFTGRPKVGGGEDPQAAEVPGRKEQSHGDGFVWVCPQKLQISGWLTSDFQRFLKRGFAEGDTIALPKNGSFGR